MSYSSGSNLQLFGLFSFQQLQPMEFEKKATVIGFSPLQELCDNEINKVYFILFLK